MDELADAFLQWRARKATAEQWRSGAARLLLAVEGEEMEIGLASWLTGAWGGLCRGRPRQDARGAWLRVQAIGDGWRHAAVGL